MGSNRKGTEIPYTALFRSETGLLISLGFLSLIITLFLSQGLGPAHSELLPGFILSTALMLYKKGQQAPWPFLVLLFFGYLFSAEALGLNIDTQVPRIKMMFRGAYYIQTGILIYHHWKGKSPLNAGLLSLILYSSFLYAPSFKLFHLSSYILFSGALIVLGFSLQLHSNKARMVHGALGLVFLLGVAISWFLATDLVHAGEGFLRVATGALILAAAYRTDEESILGIFQFAAFLTLVFFLWCLPSHLSGTPIEELVFHKYSYIGNINTNDMGTSMLLLLGPLAYSCKKEKIRWKRVLGFSLFLGILLILIYTKARSSIASLIIALVLTGGILLFLKGRTLTLLSFSIGLILLIAGGWVLAQSLSLSWVLTLDTLESRFILWDAALTSIQEAPIFGYGPDVFAQIAANIDPGLDKQFPEGYSELTIQLQNSSYFHSHNTYLQWIMELGAFGIIPIGVVFITLYIWFHELTGEKSQESTLLRYSGIGLLAFYLTSLLNYTLMVEHIWILLCLNVSLFGRKQNYEAHGSVLVVVAASVSLFIAVLIGTQLFFYESWSEQASARLYLTPTEDLIGSANVEPVPLTVPPGVLQINPGDGRIDQLFAELSLWAAAGARTQEECLRLRNQAMELYRNCSEKNDHPAFCQYRRNQLASTPEQKVQDPILLTINGNLKNAMQSSIVASEALGKVNDTLVDCSRI